METVFSQSLEVQLCVVVNFRWALSSCSGCLASLSLLPVSMPPHILFTEISAPLGSCKRETSEIEPTSDLVDLQCDFVLFRPGKLKTYYLLVYLIFKYIISLVNSFRLFKNHWTFYHTPWPFHYCWLKSLRTIMVCWTLFDTDMAHILSKLRLSPKVLKGVCSGLFSISDFIFYCQSLLLIVLLSVLNVLLLFQPCLASLSLVLLMRPLCFSPAGLRTPRGQERIQIHIISLVIASI